jgi:hypothetical protein
MVCKVCRVREAGLCFVKRPCGAWSLFIFLDDVKSTLWVRFGVRVMGADKMPRYVRYSRVSWTILSGVTMHMYAGPCVVEGVVFFVMTPEFL